MVVYETKEEVKRRVWNGKDKSKIKKILPIEKPKVDFKDRKLRVAVYCRVSTDSVSQAVSFNLQKKYYINYVRSNPNWKLVALYSDEGKSATTTKKRVGLQMMEEDARAGKFDLIITKSISRLCRNLGDSVRITRELRKLDKPVAIYFETEKMDTFNPTMRLIIDVLAIVAEEESQKKSEAITASYRQRYEDGSFTVPASLGYRRTGVNRIDIDEEEAKTVRLIYDMYLAGFCPEEIAQTLIELRRKKHTHICLNGTVKEGLINWNTGSVLRVFDNEKKCGDVLAQKTYTVDCQEHTSRKNIRNVTQYYGIDQHPAIISRDDFYLAYKLKNANKNGWRNGPQILKTYMTGVLKGYVLAVPGWHGFEAADYMRASLKAYDVYQGKESIYPDYVLSGMVESEKLAMQETEKEIEHLYVVSDEEFNSEQGMTDEECEIIDSDNGDYCDELDELRAMVSIKADATVSMYSPVSARFFYTGSKPVLTFDRNGFICNKTCLEKLGVSDKSYEIEVLYNPIYGKMLLRKAADESAGFTKLIWCMNKNGLIKMKRCAASALAHVVYRCMKWDTANKYKVYGEVIVVEGQKYLLFGLEDPVVRVKVTKPEGDNKEHADRIDISVVNPSEIEASYDEVESLKNEMDGLEDVRGDNRSKAVLFSDNEIEENTIDISGLGDMKYDPKFIKGIIESRLEPSESWDYLDGLIKWTKSGFDLLSLRWLDNMQDARNKLYDDGTRITSRDFGWPTYYSFPTKESVMAEIEELRRKLKETDVN